MKLEARPSQGYVFKSWTGDISGIADPSQPTVSFQMVDARTITANFSIASPRYVISVVANPPAGGSVTLSPNQPDYSVNQTVSVAAGANAGYVFSHWEGELTGTSPSATLIVDKNKTITAVFNPILTVQRVAVEGGTVEATPALTASGYPVGTMVSLTALPSNGYVFNGWTGDVAGIADVTQSTVSVVMTGPKSITANFVTASTRYAIGVAANPAGGGSVTLSPNQPDYSVNQTVSVAATANEGYVFSHWEGDLTGTSPSATLVVNKNQTITAVFNPILTVQRVVVEGGTVEATPALTANGYPVDTVVSLTARPSEGYVFDRWTGDVAGIADVTQSTVSVVMTGPKSITANFVVSAARYTVTVSIDPSGIGSVTLSPDQPDYSLNQTVSVTAAANAGYVFSHWEGDLTGTSQNTTLVVDGNKTITAVFYPKVMIQCDPAEGGDVEVTSPQSSEGYPVGTEITLEAKAGKGYKFMSWEGDVSGSDNPVSITMDSPKSLTAHFAKEATATFEWWWVPAGIAGIFVLASIIGLAYAGMSRSRPG